MFKKTVYFLLFLILFGGTLNAQTDSTDLNFYSTTPVYTNADDSLMYPSEMFDQIFLEFVISDTNNFGSLHIELSELNSGTIVFRKKYTLSELQSSGLINSWTVLLEFGLLEKDFSYSVDLVIESTSGSQNPKISKTLMQ